MTTTNMYASNARKIAEFIHIALHANLVPFIKSSPGVGKSSIVAKVAEECNCKLIDHRLSTSMPEDLTGLPHFNSKGEAVFAPFSELFPLDDCELPPGKDGWIVFLDEINHASREVRAAAYKLILDRMVGQRKLHPNVRIVAAGNLTTDKAFATTESTAMQSRLVTLNMAVDFEVWLYDVAIPQKYDKRIIAFLSQFPSLLMDFNPSHKEETFCAPRTWEFVNRVVQVADVNNGILPMLAGTITSGVAVQFIQFCQVYHSLVTVQQILASPESLPVPGDLNTRWAVISIMMEAVTANNLDALSIYADRFDMSMRILFYRYLMKTNGNLRRHPAFIRALIHLDSYLNG